MAARQWGLSSPTIPKAEALELNSSSSSEVLVSVLSARCEHEPALPVHRDVVPVRPVREVPDQSATGVCTTIGLLRWKDTQLATQIHHIGQLAVGRASGIDLRPSES